MYDSYLKKNQMAKNNTIIIGTALQMGLTGLKPPSTLTKL